MCVFVCAPAAGCHYSCLRVLCSAPLLAFCKCLWSQRLFPCALLSNQKFNVLHTKLSLCQNGQAPHHSMSWQSVQFFFFFFLIRPTHTGKSCLCRSLDLKWNPSNQELHVSQLSEESHTVWLIKMLRGRCSVSDSAVYDPGKLLMARNSFSTSRDPGWGLHSQPVKVTDNNIIIIIMYQKITMCPNITVP